MLSITHISFRQQETELNVGEPAKAAPHDRVTGWGVLVPSQITSQPGDSDQISREAAWLFRASE